jgi:hypothetical protein
MSAVSLSPAKSYPPAERKQLLFGTGEFAAACDPAQQSQLSNEYGIPLQELPRISRRI